MSHVFCYFAPCSLEYGKQNLSLKWSIFLPDVCKLRSHHIGKFADTCEREILFDKIAANLPQNTTEAVRFLKMFKMWVFRKTWIFIKIAKGAKFAVECVSNGIIS